VNFWKRDRRRYYGIRSDPCAVPNQIHSLLHEEPESCLEEWISYLRGHKHEALRSLRGLLLHNNRRENKYFCLNSGSCGSKYLVHLLRENGIDRCYHEKAPDLDRTGVKYFLTGSYEWVIKGLLLLTRNQIHFESSNRLFSLAPPLKKVFPESNFIHLHRNGIDSVRSNVNKTLWPEMMETATRLRYASRLAGSSSLSPFERTCHYWANINERILNDLKAMRSESVVSLRFDDLIRGNLSGLEAFLGRHLKTRTMDPANTKKNLKSEEAKVIGDFKQWPSDWKKAFLRICGPVQHRLGYEVPPIE